MGYVEADAYFPMDRAYHEAVKQARAAGGPTIERAIFPIREIGETVPEAGQRGENVVQNVQAAIRGGAGTIQIVLNRPHGQAIGSGPQAWGKDTREALREVLMASQVHLTGIELPTSLSNMSGIDPQQNKLTEETRKKHLDEVRNAIQFLADIGQGGGVDVVSFEFPRPLQTAPWNKDRQFREELHGVGDRLRDAPVMVVNEDGGISTPQRMFINTVWDPKTEKINLEKNKETGKFEPTSRPFEFSGNDMVRFEEWSKANPAEFKGHFSDFIKKTTEKNQKVGDALNPARRALLYEYFDEQTEKVIGQKTELESSLRTYEQRLLQAEDAAPELKQGIATAKQELQENTGLTPDQVARINKQIAKEERNLVILGKDIENCPRQIDHLKKAIHAQESQIEESKHAAEKFTFLDVKAKENAALSYAEAGIIAMETTEQKAKQAGGLVMPIFVGPEIGHPHSYGSHPDEFIELIDLARGKMRELLRKQGKSEDEASALAQRHIQGTFDTGHLGMWEKNFRPDILDEAKRKKEFDKWYLEQVDELVKRKDTIAQIQLVDGRRGEHGHLPAGQGDLPVIDAMKRFKAAGWRGHIVSEGHDQEGLGVGRIRTETWNALGSPMYNWGEGAAAANVPKWSQWGYVRHLQPPRQMFNPYVPPYGEYRPWAGGDNPIGFE